MGVSQHDLNERKHTMTKNLRNQLHSMINRGDSLVDVINYLFTCDYSAEQILDILTGKGFNCRRDLLIDTLVEKFGFSRLCLELNK